MGSAPVSVSAKDKGLFMMDVGAVLSLWEHNQWVISVARVLLLSPRPLEEWTFCRTAYAENDKVSSRNTRVFIS